jgi:hypothetical protein
VKQGRQKARNDYRMLRKMGNSKDYNEVIFAGKQVDEARCGWTRLKRRPEKSRVLESPI